MSKKRFYIILIFLFSGSILLMNGCSQDPYKGFKVGVQSYSLRFFTVEASIDLVRELGLGYIEIYPGHFPVNSTAEEKQNLREYLTKNDVAFVAYGVCNFEGQEEIARQYFEFAKEMGFDILTVNPTREELDFLDKLVKEFDIKCAIHNHGPGARYSILDHVLNAINGRDKRIGACIDTGHFMRSDEDPVEVAKKLGDRIHLVHLKDIKIYPDKKVFTAQGKGDMDMTEFFRTLKDIGYNGPCNLEYEEAKENPMPDMEVSMYYVRQALAGM